MSELQNPLFDEEREFLERKKLEYERALLGDVEQIKEQSVKVGRIAAVGAGLAGTLWLITKALGGKKRRRENQPGRYDEQESRYKDHEAHYSGPAGRYDEHQGHYDDYEGDYEDHEGPAEEYEGRHEDYDSRYPVDHGDDADHDDAINLEEANNDYEFGTEYFTSGNGKRYKSVRAPKSAADSAQVFVEDGATREHEGESHAQNRPTPGMNLDAADPAASTEPTEETASARHHEPSAFDTAEFEDDPFQDLPYDDSRRLNASHAFDGEENGRVAKAPITKALKSGSRKVGAALSSFLESETGKVVVANVAAVALAVVTKKVSEFFPPAKNADLATSPGYEPAANGPVTATSLASPDSPDASTHSQPL